MNVHHCNNFYTKEIELESIQGTGTLSVKMGRGDTKTSDALYQTVIDFRSSEMPPLPNNGIFKSVCWAFAAPLNRH